MHTVFAVKYRKALIEDFWKENLLGTIGNLVNEEGGKLIIVNGTNDHVHCCFSLKPSISISNIMQKIKGKSSKWVNDEGLCDTHFEWQKGYGAFSYSHSQLNALFRYVQNQKEHHKKRGFREEYLELLKKFEVDFDEQYIFHDPID
ncbi:transposase IS200-family protein [Haliscomenobacter hydrossis DSM 1100]|uniref:Transposase IS200-family protein n=1 Tax=Haliscomenobacter hydrossis (strain ATCC 27775 / DSM 1100 / LMG 10767 / O) TaxID=760192 RepID=F4KUL7_HALH1|nr:IS200/IS605 family transposase [Haliscomenobacter hydrossis]AEE52453.1 transposase IS200-family protein [Haliscomenobacter hydrossis DSM 1100]